MTNAEMFQEVFGFEPNTNAEMPPCTTECEQCKYYVNYDCRCELWWDEEYKKRPMLSRKYTDRQLAEWLKDYKRLKEQQKTGHWITHNESINLVTGDTATGGVICSECGYKTHNKVHVLIGCPYKYCPDCGAKMKEPTLNEMRKEYGLEPITKHERS